MSKTSLVAAVRRLDLNATESLLDVRPALMQTVDRQGRTLLHVACSASPHDLGVPATRQTRLVDVLLDGGLAIDAPAGKDACTPLFFAVAKARSPALVKHLLARGARPTAAPGGGLFAAGWWDDVQSLELLLGAGAPVDVVVGVTPFLASWCWRRFAAAKCLARHGANVDVQDDRGRTALHHGIEKAYDPALLKWLVRHGASPGVVNRAGVSAREMASRKRDPRYLRALTSN